MSQIHGNNASNLPRRLSCLETFQGINALEVISLLQICHTFTVVVGGVMTHIGYSLPGTATNEIGWIIMKFTYDTGVFKTGYWADASLAFDKVMDNYDSYTYSATGA